MDFNEYSLDAVMRKIYASCDPDQTGMARASTLIEFIRPYLQEDQEALAKLQLRLDPNANNVCLTSEEFYQLLGDWAKQVAAISEEDQFDRTPNHLEVMDEQQLPFLQSTPRASFGEKLLRCGAILNLSNVPNESITETQDSDKHSVILLAPEKVKAMEEQAKYLEHQVSKMKNEADMMKAQLAQGEEMNANLQAELERLQARLCSEQQLTEHLQRNNTGYEELKEEWSSAEKQIGTLNRKVVRYEKEMNKNQAVIHNLESDNTKLTESCKMQQEKVQELQKEIVDMREELQKKDQKLTELFEIRDELTRAVQERNDTIEELTSDYELLDYKRNSLEKVISSGRYSTDNFCLSESTDISIQGTTVIPIYSPNKSLNCHEVLLTPVRKLNSSKCPSTPRCAERSFGLCRRDTRVSLNKSITSLPTISCNERPNIFQDNSGENEIFLASRLAEFQKTPYDNLQNELLQAAKDLVSTVDERTVTMEKYRDDITVLQNEKESLHRKLDKIIVENDTLQKEISKLQEDACLMVLDNEKVSTEYQRRIEKLEAEIKDYKNANSFNFETVYKNAQMELNKRNLELNALSRSVNNYEEMICKLNAQNQNLERDLKIACQELDLYKNESSNNAGNRTTVQTETELRHVDAIKKLEIDVEKKNKEIVNLKLNIKKDVSIKSKMFTENKTLESEIEKVKSEKENIEAKYNKLKMMDYEMLAKTNDSKQHLKLDRELNKLTDQLNSTKCQYYSEVKKNSYLQDEITKFQKEMEHNFQASDVVKNAKLSNEVCRLKMKIYQIEQDYQKVILKKNYEYQQLIDILQDDCRRNDEENQTLNRQINKFKNEIYCMSNNEKCLEKYNENKAIKISELGEQLSIFKNKVKSMLSQQKNLEDQKIKIASVEMEIESISNSKKASQEKYEMEIVEKNIEISKLSAHVMALESKLDTYSEDYQKLEECYEKEANSTAELADKVIDLRNKLDSVAHSENMLKADNEEKVAKMLNIILLVDELKSKITCILNNERRGL